jgi:hypothetical protein
MAPFKGQGFKLSDEIYRTARPLYSRDKQLVLMSLDTSDPTTRNVKEWKEGDEDTGITWVKDVGKGRLFYCSFGHNDAIFMNPVLLEHYLRGIQFAMGDFKVPTKPKGQQRESKGSAWNNKWRADMFWRQPPARRDEVDRKAYGSGGAEEVETKIDVLRDAKYAGKQYACRELSIIGTEQSVPVLAGMLTNQEYSDMARYALERIPGEAASKALCDALPKAEGKAKIGIVNSLGERGSKPAAADIAKLVDNSDKLLAGAAISAGQDGRPDALTTG